MKIKQEFAKYVSLNILGMIGLSCYFIADTFFISKAQGSDGITALNLVLPVYGLIYAIGSMIGIGSAIRFSISKSRGESDKDSYFYNAIFFTTLFGLVFSVVGFLAPEKMLSLLGADSTIIEVGKDYTRIFMSFAPAFMWGILANAFVRNDGSPTVSMVATLLSSIFNIVFDYVLMFPCGMGMKGAALATSLSPLLGVAICLFHFLSKRCTIMPRFYAPSVKRLLMSCRVGVSAFISELSSGVTTMVFNFLILSIAGNIAVAAYGVIANVALVAVSVFNGVANGSQPLISQAYGGGDSKNVKILFRLSIITSLCLAVMLYAGVFVGTDNLILIFNSEHNPMLYLYAHTGIRLYFIGIFFACVNIAGASYFSATDKAKSAAIVSILRGLILIALFAVALSRMLGLNGVWLSYAVGEGVTTVVMLALLLLYKRRAK